MKNTKKTSKVPSHESMTLKNPKPNPFETIWSRRKFNVLGKKRKGEERRIGPARLVSIEKAQEEDAVDLKEYEKSGKSSVFIDKRIGEQNEGLGEFDKAIMRKKSIELDDVRATSWLDSMKSSSPTHRKIAKNSGTELLSSDADAAYRNWMLCSSRIPSVLSSFEHITNYAKGKRLALFPEYDGTISPIVDNPDYAFMSNAMRAAVRNVAKCFPTVIINGRSRSNHLLFQWRDEDNALKMNALKALVNKSISNEFVKKDVVFVPHKEDTLQQDKPDAYDKLVKEMTLDVRARPSRGQRHLKKLPMRRKKG
ncbi:haloacid dehalogenase-like hydrolase (HAD) superfamily protein [Actinidia rufa]|uniref:Haloacid dehalogenase-like hydrolase (HAD) superfamily protein n=1 Tax=Actinidia rufa TaxID=165716 RepID=A0A7J0FPA0_9ERIC|nr:haloacid dehalogenase-like hydrolase (HAD) superfamily protein [Actinidia rufa]